VFQRELAVAMALLGINNVADFNRDLLEESQ
jgi:hypothetical protein